MSLMSGKQPSSALITGRKSMVNYCSFVFIPGKKCSATTRTLETCVLHTNPKCRRSFKGIFRDKVRERSQTNNVRYSVIFLQFCIRFCSVRIDSANTLTLLLFCEHSFLSYKRFTCERLQVLPVFQIRRYSKLTNA